MKKPESTNVIKNLFTKVMAEKFPNMEQECDIFINVAYRTLTRHDENKSTAGHIIKIEEIQQKNRIL